MMCVTIENLRDKFMITPRIISLGCYFWRNMTVFKNHNTVDNTTIVPVNAKYCKMKIS